MSEEGRGVPVKAISPLLLLTSSPLFQAFQALLHTTSRCSIAMYELGRVLFGHMIRASQMSQAMSVAYWLVVQQMSMER